MILGQHHGPIDNSRSKRSKVILAIAMSKKQAKGIIPFPTRDTVRSTMSRCKCRRYFNTDTSDLAPPKSHYTQRVIALAVRLVVEDGLPYRAASWHLWRDHRVFVPFSTIQNWVEAGGKKSTAARRRRIGRRRTG